MSEVFYRKWRPKSLGEVVGQEAIVKTLKQAVAQGRTAHAYLFCGSRGTGKTSTARILAKAVNCLAPRGGEPDNECAICVSVNEGRALDLIEIDAASNRGIDDIRELSDKIRFMPSEARYKVYIIDEVHMLTEPAFNALLKTLEEPPSHAMFVLATTEAHKVPLTIISRCQRFDFQRIPVDRMAAKLGEICAAEGIEASADALRLISRVANGGLRDAENLLEQAAVSYGSPISEDNVRDLLGLGGDEAALELAAHVVGGSVRDGITAVNGAAAQGNDLRQLLRATVEYLRVLLLIKAGAGVDYGYSDEVAARLKGLADAVAMDRLVHALKTFASVTMRRDSASPLALELALVDAANMPEPAVVAAGAAAQGARQGVGGQGQQPYRGQPHRPQPQYPGHQQYPGQGQQPGQPQYPGGQQPAAQHSGQPQYPGGRPQQPAAQHQPPPAAAQGQPVAGQGQPDGAGGYAAQPGGGDDRLNAQWRGIAHDLRYVGSRFKLGALLNGCREREVSGDAIILKFAHRSNMERIQGELENPEIMRALNAAIAKAMGREYEIRTALANGGGGAAGQTAAQRSALVRAAQSMGARVVGEREDAPRA